VFLDKSLIFRSFTPEIASIDKLIPTGAGRSVADIVSRLSYAAPRDDVRTVLQTLEPTESRCNGWMRRARLDAHSARRPPIRRLPDYVRERYSHRLG
jgi:hypothetical protein